MLVSKLIEVRADSTSIGILVTKLKPIDCRVVKGSTHCNPEEAETYLLRRQGFTSAGPNFLYCKLSNLETYYDSSSVHKTLGVAFTYIESHWDDIASGDVVDVDYVQGNRTTPRKPSFLGG